MTTRRDFVKFGLSTGGTLLVYSQVAGCATSLDLDPKLTENKAYQSIYLKVTPKNQFVMTFDKAEMGQGVVTGQATLLGEEADIHPAKFEMQPATADSRYGNAGGHMITGGSTSTSDRFVLLRQVGANYRLRVMTAAAATWKVPIAEVTTKDGFVLHATKKKREPYSAFNRQVADLEVVRLEDTPLKKPSEWQYIGKFNDAVDAHDKITGKPEFGMDVALDGMRTAVVLRSPAYKGKLKSYDKKAIMALGDVKALIDVTHGLAIVCDSYWRCLKVKNAITPAMITWDNSEASLHNTPELYKQYIKDVESKDPKVDDNQKLLSVRYTLPFLNHAPMEPQNATGWARKDRLDIWLPTQGPTFIKAYAEQSTDYDEDQIFIHSIKYIGGGFGRRGQMDYVIELLQIVTKVDYPVKLVWSREDDMRHSPLRPMSVHKLQAVVDKEIESWDHKIAAESITQQFLADLGPLMLPSWLSSAAAGMLSIAGENPSTKEGATQPYDIPYDVDTVEEESTVPVTFWRSVGHSQNGFVVESFLDEVAHTMKQDPYQVRRKLLKKDPRAVGVVEKVAAMSNWAKYARRPGRALGMAYHFSFSTHCAQVAEVEVKGKEITIKKVWAAVDCGTVINPAIVKKQVRSGIIYGLTAALKGNITFKNGAVEQSNFHDYPLMRLAEAPEIEVAIIASTEDPTGIGEPGLPPVAGAVGNAIFAATGKRYRDLPFQLS